MQLTEKLIDRLLDVYIQSDSDLQIVKSQLEIILYDYECPPKGNSDRALWQNTQ